MGALDEDLIQAAQKGDSAAVQELLNKGADTSCRNDFGQNPLMLSCYSGNIETFLLLVDSSPLDVVDHDGHDVLMCAAEAGFSSALSNLLERNLPLRKGKYETTPLMLAAMSGSLHCTQILLPLSNPTAVDSAGRSALIHATLEGNADCVRFLLNVSNPYQMADFEMNALDIAAREGYREVIEILLESFRQATDYELLMNASAVALDSQHRSLSDFISGYASALLEEQLLSETCPSSEARIKRKI